MIVDVTHVSYPPIKYGDVDNWVSLIYTLRNNETACLKLRAGERLPCSFACVSVRGGGASASATNKRNVRSTSTWS